MSGNDAVFAGSIPETYETQLVPMIFQPYAADLVARLAPDAPLRVLEIAAGTGVVTRALAAALPAQARVVATDLKPAMLERAAAVGTARPVPSQGTGTCPRITVVWPAISTSLSHR